MTFPVPGLTTAELVRLFEAAHQGLTERDQARAELAAERQLSANLRLDNRALTDRLKEAHARLAEHEQLRAGQAADIAYLQRTAEARPTPLRVGDRPHHGPPVRCWDGMAHSHEQATALNAGARDRIEANT